MQSSTLLLLMLLHLLLTRWWDMRLKHGVVWNEKKYCSCCIILTRIDTILSKNNKLQNLLFKKILSKSGDQAHIFWEFCSPGDTLWSPKTVRWVLGYTTGIVRLLFLFMTPNEDLNMKAKKARTFLYFSFLIFYLQISWLGSSLAMSMAWVRYDYYSDGTWKKQKTFQRLLYLH